MANVKISQLPALASLSGDDVLPVVNGNVTYKVTANAIADFVGGGGGANTGNVTFDNQIVIGTGDNFGGGGLYLAQGPDSIANLQYLRVRAGDYPTHIHLDTGNGAAFDQYFGDDGKYLKLQAGGNVSIGTDYTANVWTFDTTGNLTVPGNIQSITTGFSFSSAITNVVATTGNVTVELTDNVFPGPETGQVTITDVVGTVEANGTWYFQAIFDNVFQLYYDAELQSPVDGAGWLAYVSGGSAVAAGYRALSITGGNVSIVNNVGDAWTFDNGGEVTLPDGTVMGEVEGAGTFGFYNTDGNTVFLLEASSTAWSFDGNTQVLTLPGEGVVRSNNDTIILQSYDVANSTGYGARFGTSGQLFLEQGADPAWLSFVANSANAEITAAIGTGGAGGHNLTITAGAADQTNYYTTPGGNVNLVGGLGAGNDGGGGGPGGAVNLTSGASADPAGHNGNVRINTGGANTWTFDYTGTLNMPGNVSVGSGSNVSVTNENGNPGGPGVATITVQTDANPGASAIQVGWTVTGNNLVGTTTVTIVDDLGGGLLEFTTDTAVTDPFWYNDEYIFSNVAPVWNFNGNASLTAPGDINTDANVNALSFRASLDSNFTGSLSAVSTGKFSPPGLLLISADGLSDGSAGLELIIQSGDANESGGNSNVGGLITIQAGSGTDGFGEISIAPLGGNVGLGRPDPASVVTVGNDLTIGNTTTTQFLSVTGNSNIGNAVVGNIYTDGYFYANGDPFTGGGSSLGNLSASGNVIFLPDSPQPASFVNYNTGSAMVLGTNSALPVNIVANYTSNAAQTWTFGTDGSLTAPGDISVGGNIGVTGNATVSGTDSNLIRRAFGLVPADTYITLDDLKARVTSSTNQLSLILTTGSWQGTGWTESFTGGGSAIINSWINIPLSSGFDTASLAMNSQGNGCRCVISDQTPNAKVYQITVVRSGTTGAQWNISIERLV